MGSVESGLSFKRDQHILRSSSRNERHQKPRSRLVKLVSSKKIYHLQWICAVAVFFSFVVVFQMFLPGSVVEESEKLFRENEPIHGDFNFSKEFGGLDFGEDIQFEPSKVLAKFQKQEDMGVNGSLASRRGQRFGHRKPQLALVFADLSVDPHQIQMATVAAALREIGYEIQIYSLEVGPADAVWKKMGFRVDIRGISGKVNFTVDWLNYDAILVNSIEVVELFTSLMQDPFKSVPLLWTIHDRALAIHLRQYIASGQIELVDEWKKVFSRATVVIFPNYALPMLYSACDSGNYFVIPGSPVEAWEATTLTASTKSSLRVKMDYGSDDFVIAIVGSQLVYRGIWVDHAIVLAAVLPLLEEFPADGNLNSHLKIVVLSGHSTVNYSAVVETITLKLGYPKGIVKHVAVGEDAESALAIADLVLYGSFIEELSFPEILIKAMCSGIPVIAPDLSMITKYVDDRVNGYLFPKKNFTVLTRLILQAVSNGKISSLAHNIALIGQRTAKNLMVSDSVEGYASLLGNVLKLPSEVASPRAVTEIPPNLKSEWQWHLFEVVADSTHPNKRFRSSRYLENVKKQWNHPENNSSGAVTAINESFLYQIWQDEKSIQIANAKKRREDEELKDRTDQSQGTWEEVYRSAKRADRSKNDLHERDEGELERTGQPLCIYEPYFGQGTWPFLHCASLYRGLGLSTKGRRPGADDVDGPSRLPLLNNPYYRDTLGEHGAFFAIANRIDRIHKNAWIGFQSWRATARKESLSKTAESALLNAIQARKHGDTLYFWARMDTDPRNPLQLDFWSFCDAINAGNCKFAFSEALRKMYGVKSDLRTLPPMPVDGDTWSLMHSWVLPTRSFLEFVMFSRMFVDALDAEFYDEHHQTGRCYLSLSKDKHCYSRVLELLINVWAYHSARRMVYVNPKTGVMQEHHRLMSRRGQMWIKWFQFSTLKGMDEDLAEESDSDQPKRRWLWPSTGEVFWQGVYEKEKNLRNREKEKRRQQSKDKISRIRRRARQKVLGKYVKPPTEDMDNANRTVVSDKLLR